MTRLISLSVILGLVVIFGLLSLRVMSIFLLPLLLAAMLVVIFGPMYRALRQKLGVQEWFAAGLTTAFVLIIVLVPLALLVVRAGGDAIAMAQSPNGMRLDPTVLSGLIETVNEATGLSLTADDINTELKKVAENFFGPIATRAPVVAAKLIIGVIVMTVALFYFLADGARMFDAVTRLIPLDQRYQWQFLTEFEEVSRAVVSSTLLAAIVQAILAGFGFYVAELQAVFLLTLLTFLVLLYHLLVLQQFGVRPAFICSFLQRVRGQLLVSHYGVPWWFQQSTTSSNHTFCRGSQSSIRCLLC